MLTTTLASAAVDNHSGKTNLGILRAGILTGEATRSIDVFCDAQKASSFMRS